MESSKGIGRTTFSITITAEAMARMSAAFRAASLSIAKVAAVLAREQLDLYRGEWWKRGEDGPPDWIADRAEPEWWNEGGESQEWGCAA